MTNQNGASGLEPTPEQQADARMRATFMSVMAETLPALEAHITKTVIAAAEEGILLRIKAAQAEIETYRAQQPAPASGPALATAPKNIADTITTLLEKLPSIGLTLLDAWDKAATIKMKNTNPAVMMAEWSKTNPDMLAFYASRYAPNRIEALLPDLLARNSLETANAVTKVLVRQGLVGGKGGGGSFAVAPFDELSETPDSPSDNFEPEYAEMQRGRARPRQVSLREALR